jgi:hypothetical protein
MIINASLISRFTATWGPGSIPDKTTLSYVDPTNTVGLEATLSAITASALAADNLKELFYLQREYRAAKASLTLALAQDYLQTATATQYFPQATQVIFNATLNLINLKDNDNLYGTPLALAPNMLFAILFGLIFIFNVIMPLKSNQIYFAVCFICGTGLEFAGYIGRVMAVGNLLNVDRFLCQIICLTMAPTFIMAGIYYFLAELITLYGRRYSLLKPLWFSYIFICCDVLSLFLQAVGGGMAGVSLQTLSTSETGTNIMVAGIIFQVVTMSIFLYFLFDFMKRIFFTSHPDVLPGVSNFFRLFFNTPKGCHYKSIQDEAFDPRFADIRSRPLFKWIPIFLFISVVTIYIRCIYRAIELSQGWKGFLITHETYVFCLDGAMVLASCLIFVVFHPSIVFGSKVDLSVKAIKRMNENVILENDEKQSLGDSSLFDFEITPPLPNVHHKPQKHKYKVSEVRSHRSEKRPTSRPYDRSIPRPYDRATSYGSNSMRDSDGKVSTLVMGSSYDDGSDLKAALRRNEYLDRSYQAESGQENNSTVPSSISDFSIISAQPRVINRNEVTVNNLRYDSYGERHPQQTNDMYRNSGNGYDNGKK